MITLREAWNAWSEIAGTPDLATEFTLENSSHGKAFSFAWAAAVAAEREQSEPVAWMDIDEAGNRLTVRQWSDGNRQEVPLYTAPTPRKPLTENEIGDAANSVKWSQKYHVDFARAIERAIWEKNNA